MISKRNLIPLIITATTAIASYLIYGWWLEEYEAVYWNLFSGQYGNQPYDMVFTDTYAGLFPLLSKLTSAFSPFPMGVIMMYVLITLGQFLVNRAVHVLAQHKQLHSITTAGVLLLLNVFLMLPFYIQLQCGRVSILLVVAGFLTWFSTKESPTWRLASTVVLFLVIGSFSRIYTAWIATGLMLFLSMFYYGTSVVTKRMFWMVSMILLMQTYAVFSFEDFMANSGHIGRRYELFYEYPVTDRGDVTPLKATANSIDSVKYTMLTNWLVTDTCFLSESYVKNSINHLSLPQIINDRRYLGNRVNSSIHQLYFWTCSYSLLLISLFILIAPSIAFSKWTKILQFVIWTASFTFVILVLTILSGMFDRAFHPFLLVFFTAVLMLLMPYLNRIEKNVSLISIALISICAVLFLSQLHETSSAYNHLETKHERWKETIRNFEEGNPLIILNASLEMFNPNALKVFQDEPKKNCLILHAGYFCFYDFMNMPYKKKWKVDATNGNTLTAFIKRKYKEDLFVWGTKSQADLFEQYMNVAYHYPVGLTPVHTPLKEEAEARCLYRINHL